MLWPKKIHTRNLIPKKFLRLENSPPPPTHNFPNGLSLRDGPLENLWGGGGGGRSTKTNSRKGKLNEKILARQLTLKNIHAMA